MDAGLESVAHLRMEAVHVGDHAPRTVACFAFVTGQDPAHVITVHQEQRVVGFDLVAEQMLDEDFRPPLLLLALSFFAIAFSSSVQQAGQVLGPPRRITVAVD